MHKGLTIATAAATLFLAGAVTARAADKKGDENVQCEGDNACKGKGACATAKNDCAGKNACKGQGMVEMSAEDCKAKGGKIQEKKAM